VYELGRNRLRYSGVGEELDGKREVDVFPGYEV
jgi:hypothetical protein